MKLSCGARVGPYEIVAPLGAGGMGEVYRARDTKLGRDVAIKVLPAAVADDPDRITRFQREAHLLAALNHPGIATVHGFEESDAHTALVMELVPGPTLAERIVQGALPLDEALPIARQIAEALEYAHERGVIHRDLKPANVKLTADGAVKVLDFGLAKALADEPATADASQSPTLSAVATRAGMILGTAAYMSPEQAKGKAADRRTDIWSFGVVLYEMLGGKRMFTGDTAAETLASVLKTEPEWGGLPAGTPPSLRRLLRRCLEKDPRRRVQAIGEVRITIEDTLAGVAEGRPAEEIVTGSTEARARPDLLWVAALVALLLGLGVGAWAPWRRMPPAQTPLRLSIELGADGSLFLGAGASVALSADGSKLAFVAVKEGGGQQLHLRRLDQAAALPLSGTDNARNPFFSPDGAWIGFFADSKLKKVATTGGAAVALCDAPEDRGGTWAEDGTILFTPYGNEGGGLLRVSSTGGTPEPFTKIDPAAGVVTDRWPQALPGGAVLFTSFNRTGGYDDASLAVQRLANGPRKVVHRGGYHGRYLRSGHLVYMHKGTLFAAPFDLERLELTGPAVPALDGVVSRPGSAGTQFTVSEQGLLAYLPGAAIGGGGVPIQWLDANGKTRVLQAAPADAGNVRFSPDGGRLAMDVYDGTQRDVWVYDWERDIMSRLTFDPENDNNPVWSPDGRSIVFSSARADKRPNLYLQPADGTGEAQRLTQSTHMQVPTSWHPSGKFLVFEQQSTQTTSDVMILPLEFSAAGFKAGKPAVFLNSPRVECEAAFSPDGQWLAYVSTESGTYELFVRAFPGPGGKWQVSTGGGRFPTWSRAGKRLFYRSSDRKLMASDYVVEGDSFHSGKPRVWSATPFEVRGPYRPFDLHPDGQRFAVLKSLTSQAETKSNHVTLIVNFADELRRIAPARKR